MVATPPCDFVRPAHRAGGVQAPAVAVFLSLEKRRVRSFSFCGGCNADDEALPNSTPRKPATPAAKMIIMPVAIRCALHVELVATAPDLWPAICETASLRFEDEASPEEADCRRAAFFGGVRRGDSGPLGAGLGDRSAAPVGGGAAAPPGSGAPRVGGAAAMGGSGCRHRGEWCQGIGASCPSRARPWVGVVSAMGGRGVSQRWE